MNKKILIFGSSYADKEEKALLSHLRKKMADPSLELMMVSDENIFNSELSTGLCAVVIVDFDSNIFWADCPRNERSKIVEFAEGANPTYLVVIDQLHGKEKYGKGTYTLIRRKYPLNEFDKMLVF